MSACAVCVVCWNVDLVIRVPRLRAPGKTVFGDAFDSGLGGKGSNVAVRLAPGQTPLPVDPWSVHTVDTVGAGDAFNAGLAMALAEGAKLAQAERFASATAALATTRHGAALAMPQRNEVDIFLAAYR